MQTGDVVRVTSWGRAYLGKVERQGPRSVQVRFLTAVPLIEGRRRRVRAFRLGELEPYGKAGVDYVLRGGRR